MKPLDPRLLRYARSARGVLLIGAMLGLVRTIAILGWSWCLAQAIVSAVLPVLGGAGGESGRIGEGGFSPDELPWLVLGALVSACVRAAAGWGMDVVAARGAVRVKSQLRSAALDALQTRSPVRDEDTRSDAEMATVLGRGLDALDGYFSGYVPQLILTAVSTPILVLALLLADPISGITVLIVFPVIPIFMILIGLATQAVQDRQWSQLQRLSASFLDAVSGLATLRIFGREHRQSARIARETEEYRSRTMKVLRVTFLSGFVLDLAGTFSIALVAVTVGTRLTEGAFPLGLGLFVLLLLPETFIPIRQVGAAFHASSEGLAASADAFEIIESGGAASTPASTASTAETACSGSALSFDSVTIARGGRPVVGPVSFDVSAGEVVALAGPSGAGKSTLLAAVLGFIDPASGAIARSGAMSWCGQRPGLMQGSVAANVSLGDEQPDPALVRRSLDGAGLTAVPMELELGALGTGISGGQAQRVAVARCLYRAETHGTPILLFDEPTSALDSENEALVAAALRREADRGRAVLVVSHRLALLDKADRIVRIGSGGRA